MSKGNPAVKVRLRPEVISQLKETYERINLTRKEEPYVMSTFLVSCIEHRLRELRRQERYRKGKGKIPIREDRTVESVEQ